MTTRGYFVPLCPSLYLGLSSQLYKLNPSDGERGTRSEQIYVVKLKLEHEANNWEEAMPMIFCL